MSPRQHPVLYLLIIAAARTASPAAAVEARPVSFAAADGVRIAADFYAPPVADRGPAPMVILLHDAGAQRKSWEPLLPALHEAGFAVLALDLRGHGESAGTDSRERAARGDPELFRGMQADLRGAYDWLAAQAGLDRARFALVGAGTGAGVAIQYAAKDRSVDAVACLSPGLSDHGLDVAGDMHQITGRRILLLAAQDDRDAPYTLQQRGTGVEVRLCRGTTAHGTALLTADNGLPRELARFLRGAVGEPTGTLVYCSIERNIYHEPDSAWVREISATNLRYYSSAQEAEARGLRASASKGPPTGRAARDGESRRRRP